MSKSKHTEAQMIAALKQVEAGRKVEDVAREFGVSKHTVYAWKAKYGGMDVTEAQEAKQLRDENTRLRDLPPADQHTTSTRGLNPFISWAGRVNCPRESLSIDSFLRRISSSVAVLSSASFISGSTSVTPQTEIFRRTHVGEACSSSPCDNRRTL